MRRRSSQNPSSRHGSSPHLLPLLAVCALLALTTAPARADWEAGVAAFKVGRFATAAAEFRQVTETHPDWADGHFMLGSALLHLDQPAEALPSLEKAVALGGELRHRLSLAQAQLRTGAADAALATLAELSPTSLPEKQRDPYFQLLAGAASRTGRTGPAIAALEGALKADPGNAVLWQALGQARGKAGQPRGAFDACARAFELAPEPDTGGRLAVQIAFDAAAGSDGEDRQAWYARAATVAEKLAAGSGAGKDQLLAGEAHLGSGDYGAARSWFEKARSSLPGQALPLYRLGRADLADGDAEGALSHFDAALAAPASSEVSAAEIHTARGAALRHLERFSEAATAYARAGNEEKAGEMETLAGIATGNAEHDRLVASCRAKKARLDKLRAETWPTLAPADQLRFQQDMEAALADCRPYLEEPPDRGAARR